MDDIPSGSKRSLRQWLVVITLLALGFLVGLGIAKLLMDFDDDQAIPSSLNLQQKVPASDAANLLLAQMAPRIADSSLSVISNKTKGEKIPPLVLTLSPRSFRTEHVDAPVRLRQLEMAVIEQRKIAAQELLAAQEMFAAQEDVVTQKSFTARDKSISPAKEVSRSKTSEDGFPYEEHFVAPSGFDAGKMLSFAPVTPPAVDENTEDRVRNTLAVIIDDLGYNVSVSQAMLALPADLTLAILPGGSYSQELAKKAHAAGREVLLHQPMEPWGYPRINPGPGAVFLDMDVATIQRVLQDNIELFPEAVGVNNHMGSRFTGNPQVMDAVMTVLGDKQLFFVDSRTSVATVGESRAVANQVPSAARDVFIDNVPDVDTILQQLAELERQARQFGGVIGIGHPYRATWIALKRWLPTLQKRGIRLLRVSRFLRPAQFRKLYPDLGMTDGFDNYKLWGNIRATHDNTGPAAADVRATYGKARPAPGDIRATHDGKVGPAPGDIRATHGSGREIIGQ